MIQSIQQWLARRWIDRRRPSNYDSTMSRSIPRRSLIPMTIAAAVVVLGALLATSFVQTCLSSRRLSGNFISPATAARFAAPASQNPIEISSDDSINIPFSSVLTFLVSVAATSWIGGAIWLKIRTRIGLIDALVLWGRLGWIWWCLVDLWEWLWIATSAMGFSNLASLLSATPQFWLATCVAGWLTTLLTLGSSAQPLAQETTKASDHRWVWLVCGLYFVVFTTMNWRLYFNLLVPHGDSVMYEEHLWNFLHGKGFRSYLDRGLFLGEHIQFVHLFLIPLYVIWPSHLLLEACSSAALAAGALPVFWMVRRHTGSGRTALAIAVAYLLYTPTQFLDIEIDLKTFRPESFGIPFLLFTLDQLDRCSLRGTLIGIALCLTVKEDYTLIFGPLGLWIASTKSTYPTSLSPSLNSPRRRPDRRLRIAAGLGLSAVSVFYLWIATRVIMPWFRSGVEVHYASYFSRFGKSPEEIVLTILTRPSRLIDALLTPETALYAIAMLAPLAFLPLLAPGRIAVGLPLFAILCLNELEGSRTPQHQFHAPLVAVVFWALAAALPRATAIGQQFVGWKNPASGPPVGIDPQIFPRLVWTSALATGLFFSLSPLGIPFWDPGANWYWRRLYASNHRSEMFARIATLIPQTARVASTDFVHPRYTHFARSYDYSEYQRQVSGEGKRLPDDTDYLVIDTDHRYSKIKKPSDVPELRDHPDQWELVPDLTDGYFIVLKRKANAAAKDNP